MVKQRDVGWKKEPDIPTSLKELRREQRDRTSKNV